MKLGVLDYGLVDYKKNSQIALKETVLLAKEAEKLGYSSFWVAEHHNISAFSTTAPEIIIIHLLNQTKNIKICSGGIMPLHYSEYKISEIMNTIEAIYPNRVNFGLGSTLGTTVLNRAMRSIHQKLDYEKVLKKIISYSKQNENIKVYPKIESNLGIFLLSNSINTAKIAGELGLGYIFGVFPYMEKDMYKESKIVHETYIKNFKKSDSLLKPHFIIACFVVIAETEKIAEDFAKCLDIWMLGKDNFNEFKTYPTVKEAKKYVLTDKEKEIIISNRQRVIIGDKKQVKEKLDEFINISNADEVLVIPLIPGIENRCKALKLLAEIYI
ncbi:MsnO8 family LLM class oxidoreductase [Oceanivirga salmonicida]|uniref:MsnO8 family LLM class oxidoreductase n=1 Tax=Oceanivirga salmonicida TaxID=1769291 RepID=UPI00082A99C3|nr:MsnO8 family LLM class oxidoreductase [Oceanivirga salmonicida]